MIVFHDSFLAAKSNGACSSYQIHKNSPQTYTERGRVGGKKIPLYVFCLLQIFRRCLDGGGEWIYCCHEITLDTP